MNDFTCRSLHGRQKITADTSFVDENNVVDVLTQTDSIFASQSSDIDYLYRYYKGEQPILNRKRDVRPELTSNIVENRAYEIITFKVGSLIGEPVQYVSTVSTDKPDENVNKLNVYMVEEDKEASDRELIEWIYICGVGFRMCLPKAREFDVDGATDYDDFEDESPFEINVLDPRSTYLVYSNSLRQKPLMSVSTVALSDGERMSCVYTSTHYYEVVNSKVTKIEPHAMKTIPVFEYTFNNARLGAFEVCLSILDAINNIETNRVEAISQFVQALMLLKGVDIDDDTFKKVKDLGGILVPPDGDVDYIVQELNQTQTQTLVDHMYQTVLTICGMPNRHGNSDSSTSDTGKSVIFRDGWNAAEARAKDDETLFKKTERRFLKLVSRICNAYKGTVLNPSDIEIRFTRRNYENLTEKVNVLISMLNNDKIDPHDAYVTSELFSDTERAYSAGMAYYRSELERQENELRKIDIEPIESEEEDV